MATARLPTLVRALLPVGQSPGRAIRFYWTGTPQEFLKLHDHAIAGVRRALPTAPVGGPDVAGSGGQFMEDFLTHVTEGTNYAAGQRGTPTDFLRFHAKGSPKVIDGHVRIGIAAQLATIDEGFRQRAGSSGDERVPNVQPVAGPADRCGEFGADSAEPTPPGAAWDRPSRRPRHS
jgi:hypothetical protein